MASAPFVTDLPVERPEQRRGSHFDEPFIEPYLAKHSEWYRRHLASKNLRKESVTEADLAAESERRSSSVASETNEQAPTSSEPQPGIKHAGHLPEAEQKPRRGSVMRGLRFAFWYNGNESTPRNMD